MVLQSIRVTEENEHIIQIAIEHFYTCKATSIKKNKESAYEVFSVLSLHQQRTNKKLPFLTIQFNCWDRADAWADSLSPLHNSTKRIAETLFSL